MHFQAWLDILELEPKIMYCDYRSKWTSISIFDGQLDTKEREREGGESDQKSIVSINGTPHLLALVYGPPS